MPTFDFTSPDGHKYRVTAPDGATQQQAFQMLQKQLGSQQPSGSFLQRDILQPLNRGIINMVSLPGDLGAKFWNAVGLNKLTGVQSESYGEPIRREAEKIGTIAHTEAPGILPKAMEFLGGSMLPEAGMIAKGGRVLEDVSPELRSVWQDLTAKAAESPGKGLAANAAGSLGAATGGEVAKRFSDNPAVEALGELAGGFLPAIYGLVSPTANSLRYGPKMLKQFFKSGAEDRAAARLQGLAQNPKTAAESIGTAPEFPPAMQTQEPGLMALHKAIIEGDPAAAAEEARNVAAARRGLQSQANFGSTEPVRPALTASLQAPIEAAQAQAENAAHEASQAIEQLGPNASARDISEIAHDAIEKAHRNGRFIEKKLWDQVDQEAPAVPTTTRAVITDEIANRSPYEDPTDISKWLRDSLSVGDDEKLPGWAQDAIDSGKGQITAGPENEGPDTLGDLRAIRSRVLHEAREERAKPVPNRNKLRILENVQNALLDDMGNSDAAGPLAEARAYSRIFNQRFSTGKIAQIRGFERTGGERVDPRDTLATLMSGQGSTAAARQMIAAAPGTRPLLKNYLKAQFLASATDENGVNTTAANRFIKNLQSNGTFEVYPELKDELQKVTSLSQGAKALGLRADDIKRLAFHSGKSRAALYLNAPVGDEMKAVFGARDPNAVAASLRRRVGSDPKAQQGLKTAFTEHLMKQARTGFDETGEPIVSGGRFDRLLKEYAPTAKALGMTDEEMGRLSNIAGKLKLAEQNASSLKGPIMNDTPGTVLDLLARIIGARAGERLGGEGLGGSLVLAQAGSNIVRKLLKNLTVDKAEETLVRAQSDPKLYKALLLKPAVLKNRPSLEKALEDWMAPAKQYAPHAPVLPVVTRELEQERKRNSAPPLLARPTLPRPIGQPQLSGGLLGQFGQPVSGGLLGPVKSGGLLSP